MSDLPYWVALTRVPTIGRARFSLLEQRFGSVEAAWSAPAAQLRAAGLDERATTALVNARTRISPEQEMERLEQAGVRAVTWHDEGYPPPLREIYDLPPVLFIKGSLAPEDQRSVAVVGTRRATAYGREVATHLTSDLARHGITIVSGLARGIDSVAHRAALDAGGRTIAILAGGLDRIYPPEHTGLAQQIIEQGALISEYHLGVRPEATHFPRRNRLLSGMTLGTLVIEAPEGSGAIWTVRHALEQDREVFCVPGSILSPASRATNALIQEGAKLVMDFKDVLEELNLSVVTQQMPMPGLLVPEDDMEAALLKCLTFEPLHIDDVQRRSGLPISTVSGTLAVMEIKGLVRRMEGMNYVRAREAAASYGATR